MVMNCNTGDYKSYGPRANITERALEHLKRKNVEGRDKQNSLMKALDAAIIFLEEAIEPDEELFLAGLPSRNTEFGACLRMLSTTKQVDQYAPANEGLRQAKIILQGHLTELRDILGQFVDGDLGKLDAEKLEDLRKFFDELLQSENERETEFRNQHAGNPFTNLIVSAGKLA